MENMWIKDYTLSTKHKLFHWYFTVDEGIVIKRVFENQKEEITKFNLVEINRIIDFIESGERTKLKNNVQKLNEGIEDVGLGQFVKTVLSKKTLDAQATSQLAAIFVHTGILNWNGKSRNMEFWLKNKNWINQLESYKRIEVGAQ